MKGRKPTPNPVKLLRGSKHANHNAVDLPAAIPDPPAYLDEIALVEWSRVCGVLSHAGVITHADRAVLAGYCNQCSLLERALQQIAQHGETQVMPSGAVRPSAWLRIANEAHDRMVRTAAELGLSPSSRSRVHPAKSVTPGVAARERDISRFFNGGVHA